MERAPPAAAPPPHTRSRKKRSLSRQGITRRRRTFPLESQIKLNIWVRQHPDATDEEIRAWVKESGLYKYKKMFKPIGSRTIRIARKYAQAAKAEEDSSSTETASDDDDSSQSLSPVAISNLLSQGDSDKENKNTLSQEIFEENKKHTARHTTPKPPCGQNHEPCNCFRWDEQKLTWVHWRQITK